MQTATAQYQGPTEILCRFDRNLGKPVVYIAHTMDPASGQIQMWDGNEIKFVPLHEYQRTDPLAKADEEILAKRFAKAIKDNSVVVRHRLPRTARPRVALLASNTGNNQQPQQGQQAPAKAPVLAQSNTPAAAPGEVPATTESSEAILAKIREESARVASLSAQVHEFSQKLQQATADHDTAQKNYAVLTAQYQQACEREAADELAKRQQKLQEALAPLDALAQESKGQQQPQAKETPAPAANAGNKGRANRGAGGRFQKSAPIPPAAPDAAVEAFKQLSPAQRDAALKAAGLQAA